MIALDLSCCDKVNEGLVRARARARVCCRARKSIKSIMCRVSPTVRPSSERLTYVDDGDNYHGRGDGDDDDGRNDVRVMMAMRLMVLICFIKHPNNFLIVTN